MEKSEKLKLIRDYAQTLGICRTCIRQEARENGNNCQKCFDVNKRTSLAQRRKPNKCSRCGCDNDRLPLKKTCSKCSIRYKNDYREKYGKNT